MAIRIFQLTPESVAAEVAGGGVGWGEAKRQRDRRQRKEERKGTKGRKGVW